MTTPVALSPVDGQRAGLPRTAVGATVWFTGLPSAGKSTLADALAAALRPYGRPVEVLDGDRLRAQFFPELGYSRADRDTNVARIGLLARMLARNGVLVLAAVVSPYAAARAAVRAAHAAEQVPFLEVHVATPVAVCRSRDVKGLYARADRGELTGLTGVDGDYEPPTGAELVLDTGGRPVTEAAELVRALLAARGLA